MELDWQDMLFQFLGGLGLFLFSIKYMGEGLQKSADNRLRQLLDRFTSNPLMGVFVGILVTVLIQSSSATTVLTVGLVSGGFMTLRQAIGVIMGANIGTTVTAFIIGIDIGTYYYPMIAIGAFLIFFFKKSRLQHIGQIAFGFGGLFLGLEMMSTGMEPLHHLDGFLELMVNMKDQPILGVFIGTIFTLCVQSSSATVGVLQGVYAADFIQLKGALPVLFGENIGTTLTAVIASLGATVAAKRAAAIHVLFNVIGTLIFLVFLVPFTSYVEWLGSNFHLSAKMQIAFAHGSFNIINTCIQLPFIAVLAYIVMKVIPGDDSVMGYKTRHLDQSFIEKSPSIALGQAKEEVLHMGEMALKGLEETFSYLQSGNGKHKITIRQIEGTLNQLDTRITNYVVLISKESLTDADSVRHHMLLNNIRDIERIGDHFENILELLEYKENQQVNLSEAAQRDLELMFRLTIDTVKLSLDALNNSSVTLAIEVGEKEALIDEKEIRLRQKHIARMNLGECSGTAGLVFTDIVSNLERIGDHAVNIADTILGIRH